MSRVVDGAFIMVGAALPHIYSLTHTNNVMYMCTTCVGLQAKRRGEEVPRLQIVDVRDDDYEGAYVRLLYICIYTDGVSRLGGGWMDGYVGSIHPRFDFIQHIMK